MAAYFLPAILIALLAVIQQDRRLSKGAWWFGFTLLVVIVGLRHKVGMDWNNYLAIIDWSVGVSFDELSARMEPGVAFLIAQSNRLGFGIYGVNLVAAIVLLLGVFKLCSRMSEPWLGLLAAYPYLIVVVGNSALRQSLAAGVLLWLVASWRNSSLVWRLSLILLASLFHYSAAIFFVFVALDLKITIFWKSLVTAFSVVLGIWVLQRGGAVDYYLQTYVTDQTQAVFSPGALQHTLLNGLPALLLLLSSSLRSRSQPSELIIQMSVLALFLAPLSLVTSTAASRATIYLFPVSIFVFSSLPLLYRNKVNQSTIRLAVVLVLFVQMTIWLNLSNSRAAYVPYKNVLLIEPYERHL